MAISDQIERLQDIKDTLRTALVGLGLVTSESMLDACAEAVAGIPNRGAVQGSISDADVPYTVPDGYHNGEGTVGIASAEKSKLTPGNIKAGVVILGVTGSYSGEAAKLQAKTATPSKSQQTIAPTSGKVLTQVVVAAIPDAYQDVTGVTAVAADVLTGKTIVNAAGDEVAGTMPNNGTLNKTMTGLTDETASVSIPAGYTSGGTVTLTDDIETALAAL